MLLGKSASVWLQAAKTSCLHFRPQTFFSSLFHLQNICHTFLRPLCPTPCASLPLRSSRLLLPSLSSLSNSPLPFSFLQPPHPLPSPSLSVSPSSPLLRGFPPLPCSPYAFPSPLSPPRPPFRVPPGSPRAAAPAGGMGSSARGSLRARRHRCGAELPSHE